MFTLRPSHLDNITYLLFEEVKHRQSEWPALSRAQRARDLDRANHASPATNDACSYSKEPGKCRG